FEDAGAHAGARLVTLLRVLGELQGPAAPVADRERRPLERAVAAALQRALEGTGAHLVDEIERARTELDALFRSVVVVILSWPISLERVPGESGCGDQCSGNGEARDVSTHHGFPSSCPSRRVPG